jgi:hypothetical protein
MLRFKKNEVFAILFLRSIQKKNFLPTYPVGGLELKDWYDLLLGQLVTSSGGEKDSNCKQKAFMCKIKSPG